MNKYLELKMKQSKEFRKLPMKVAFGKKQFEEIMKQWGLTTFFEKDGYQIGNEIKEKGNETYAKTLFLGNVIIETEYKIIKYN